jgi:hypothetical protein
MEVPAPMRIELDAALAALAANLRLPRFEVEAREPAKSVDLRGDVLLVPGSMVQHWERFGVMPTTLLRDAAYAARRLRAQLDGESGAGMEADAHAYAERFLRDFSLGDRD